MIHDRRSLHSQALRAAVDPRRAARVADLTYVTDAAPGIRRRRFGRAFRYYGPDGRPLQDAGERERIRRLVVPPAWRDVWICPDPHGHIQAIGRDARGRRQYRYHPRWRQLRDEAKFSRMVAFGRALPTIRASVEGALSRPGLNREKVLALVVRLLEITLIRVGNEEYARDNASFGLTTLRRRHVAVSGEKLRFRFRGKSGKEHAFGIRDRRRPPSHLTCEVRMQEGGVGSKPRTLRVGGGPRSLWSRTATEWPPVHAKPPAARRAGQRPSTADGPYWPVFRRLRRRSRLQGAR